MPVTIAHPIAAIPLRRPLGRLGVLSALVIGSIMPDVPFFLPLALNRNPTHSAIGLFWFCLPVGVAAYLLYDRVLERPVRALMPDGLQRRLAPVLNRTRPPAWSAAVLVSILAGAATHLAWDTLTHSGVVSRWFPLLETRLFTVSGYTAYVFSVLQHASSMIGTTMMAAWMWRWYRTAPTGDWPAATGLTPRARRWLLLVIAGIVIAAVVLAGVSRFPARPTLRALQPFVRRLIVAGLSSLFASVTVYAVAWHWMRARVAARTA